MKANEQSNQNRIEALEIRVRSLELRLEQTQEPECKCYHNAWEKVTRFCEVHKEKPAKKECCPDCGLEDCVHWELDKCKEKNDELSEVKLPEYHHPCLLCRKWAVEQYRKWRSDIEEHGIDESFEARLKESK